jgi:hypothetical protein
MATTDEVRDRWLVDPYDHFPRLERGEEFDQWLLTIQAKAWDAAMEQAADYNGSNGCHDWALPGPEDNPHRQKEEQ